MVAGDRRCRQCNKPLPPKGIKSGPHRCVPEKSPFSFLTRRQEREAQKKSLQQKARVAVEVNRGQK